MNPARFDLNLLNALDMLLRERSVTAAGKRLGVSQSAMSGMLARLREQLGDPLLVRVGNALVPTPRADALGPEVRQLLARLHGLVALASDLDLAHAKRRLKIMASEHSMLLILPEVYRRAADVAPALEFDILATNAPSLSVANDEVDLCLVGGPIDDLGKMESDVVRTRKILEDPFVALVDVTHDAPTAQITLEQLALYPRVSTQFPGVPQTVDEIILSGDVPPHSPVIRVPGFLAMGPALAGSKRLGIIPSMLAPLMTGTWSLRTISLPATVPPASLRMLWHERYHSDPLHQWLRLTIEEACRALRGATYALPPSSDIDSIDGARHGR